MADGRARRDPPAGRDRRERLEDEAALGRAADAGRSGRRDRNSPPLHRTMSRSSTRGPQRRPRRRPKSRSSAFRRASISGGSRSLSTSATALAKSRPAPPCAALRTIGEASNRPNSSSSRAIAASTTRGGPAVAAVRPVRADRDGVEVRHASPVIASPAKQSALVSWIASPPVLAMTAMASPPTCRRSPRPRRRATARCARGWSRSARSAAPSIPAGGTRRCRRSATATPGWRSSASRPASTAPTAPGGRSPAIMPASCSTRRWLKFGLAEGEYRAESGRRAAAQRRDHPQRGQMPAAGEQARAARDRDLPAIISRRRWRRCRRCA